MRRIPFLIVGDGPAEPTGLGRIARDLAGLLVASDLPLDLVQVGGSIPPVWTQWRHFALDRSEEWGAAYVQQLWTDLWGDQPGVLFLPWDPGRLWPYCQIDLPVQRWCYTAIDGANVHDQIGGPALAALQQFDRVLAYGRYGADILKRSLQRPIEYLPHGLMLQTYAVPATDAEQATVRAILGPYCREGDLLIGCVATNQFRKELGLFFHALRVLLNRGHRVFGWLHTDIAVKAWSVQQLAHDFDVERQCRVTIRSFTDRDLAVLYQACDVTVLPSQGEGFGYPLVESLASGTPCISGDCAGGAELIPKLEWRVPRRAERLEGIYALKRPVFEVADVANAIERALEWRTAIGRETAAAYCRGSVAHLDWTALWGRWRSWFKQGLRL